MFKPVAAKVDFPVMEREILAWWQENKIVKKYLKRNDGADKKFSFIDGPITANNLMGVHHAWGRSYKDLFQRYKTMQGFRQRYQNGFDGQGLWIEVEVEKELGLNSKRDIEVFGIDKFVELCKERVRKFSEIMTQQSIRLGYWMDWDNSYQTMSDENNYTIWHFLKVCHERGWIYEGTDVMPWCPRCGTGLSEHEIVTEGYKEIVHPGLYVRFPLLDRDGESLLIWTTTPWTLAANTAACIHPEKTYVKARGGDDEILYLLKQRVSELGEGYEVLEEMLGKSLVGLRYSSPFGEFPAQEGTEHRVVAWEEVSENEGTGIVHTAPGAGKEDFELSKKENLSVIAPLDEFGVFVDGFDWLSGKSVFEVNDLIYESLKDKGLFHRLDNYSHRYPVCWRCNTELVFRLVDEWYISMEELRGLIAEVTQKIQWTPSFGMQRELDWLRNMDDWMISKKRYWGLALPIYKCECGHFDVIGSEAELETRAIDGWSDFDGNSPHRPWVDFVKIQCKKCGNIVSRIRDVGNPWLDAGIVPFSTIGYRSDKSYWQEWFPADWISESFPGQFRNWFYSLLTMSTVLEGREPFRAIFGYATMRDENGEEMHKSKGNAIEFEEAADRMGVDAMRWLYARQNPSANMNFGFGVADQVRRGLLIPMWNVYSFFITYANIDQFDPRIDTPPVGDRSELDRWIISELNSLVLDVSGALDSYDPDAAARSVENFVDYLSNWYVRRSRRRFWKSGILGERETGVDDDKLYAYVTLYECLTTLAKLIAPIMPFVAESMYQNLVRTFGLGRESVHLETYPSGNETLVDQKLSDATRLAMRISSLGRAARSKAGIKVRQPLGQALVKLKSREEEMLKRVEDQVKEELNVKAVLSLDREADVVEVNLRANMALLGPKYGKDVHQINVILATSDTWEIKALVDAHQMVEINGFVLEPEEVMVETRDLQGYSTSGDGFNLVAIKTDISEDLKLEGLAREIVHRIQNMRRSAGFDIADHIMTFYQGSEGLNRVMISQREYIQQETLSRDIINAISNEGAYVETHEIDNQNLTIGVKRT